jgi:hypothetical protein
MERADDILKRSKAAGRYAVSDQGVLAPIDDVELAFLTRELIQLTLPHRDPGDVPLWTRTNGNLTLVMARTDIDDKGTPIGYPYGSIPRLLLHWLNSEVVRTKEKRIELGNNLSQFMRDIDLNPDMGSGKRSDARRLREQMNRLFSASIRFTRRTETTNGERGKRSKIAAVVEDSQLWWDHRNPRQSYLWGSWIELSDTFYNTLLSSPVPLNKIALKALKRSPLALDLYSWVCYRSWRATKLNTVQRVPWVLIQEQFGAEYAELRNFRQKSLAALRKIVELQPEIRIRVASKCLEIRPGLPIIPVRAQSV